MRPNFSIGIRGRLFFAFASVVATCIVATVVGWVSFARLADTLAVVVGENIAAVRYAAQLAERGGGVIGAAPALEAASSEVERERIWLDLSRRLQDMTIILQSLEQAGSGGGMLDEFVTLGDALKVNLGRLNTLVSDRLERNLRKEELIKRLRWSSADFLDEVEPLIDDTRFNIGLALRQSDPAIAGSVLSREIDKQRVLLKINADGNLLSELINRATNLPGQQALDETLIYFDEITGRLHGGLEKIADVPGVLSLRQSAEDLIAFANRPEGIFRLRQRELEDLHSELELLARNQELLGQMHDLITRLVEAENRAALTAADQAQMIIQQGKIWLLFAVLVSFAIAAPFVWLYVGRGLVGRIRTLDDSMKVIARGDLDARVPVDGEDEIGEMADSLRTFRDTLAETQAELIQSAKLAALGQLSAGISHEINQPLSAIRHYARNTGLLLGQGRLDEARDNIARISDLIEKTNRIIDGLRSLSRKSKSSLRATDVRKVLNEVLNLLQQRLDEHHVGVEVFVDDQANFVMADEVRLEQVLLNLFNNAIDAMRASAVRRLIVSSRVSDDWVELRVRDSGDGVAPEVMQQIFDPFFTTKEVGDGLGLGLSVSYNIIRDFGGAMRVESHEDGAELLLRLKPAKNVHSDD